ncbi:TPA: hypothetical protein ACH3X1_015004 [Trebouxia sp. C0004]
MAGPADITHAVQGVTPSVIALLQRVLPRQPEATTTAHASLHLASDSLDRLQKDGQISQLDAREQAGSDLWDATQSEGPATIAVANSGLDIITQVVLHAISHQQLRLAELLLGALANILCHERLAELVIKVLAGQRPNIRQHNANKRRTCVHMTNIFLCCCPGSPAVVSDCIGNFSQHNRCTMSGRKL